jgi:hypothetical protein
MTATPPSPPEKRPEQVRVRRSAKILNFLLTGAFLGAVAALILTFAFPGNDEYPASQVFGFLLLLGVALGAALGGLVAVLLDRSLQRRARDVDAVREVTVAPEEARFGDVPDGAQSDSIADADPDAPAPGTSDAPRS